MIARSYAAAVFARALEHGATIEEAETAARAAYLERKKRSHR